MFNRDDGFTLVELMVVVAIISVLITIGVASYFGMTRIADTKGVQLDLVTAAKVQTLQQLESDEFSDDSAVLGALEPALAYSATGVPAGTIVVRVEPGREAIDVCLFSQTEQGNWFSIHHSVEDGDAYAESAPVDCVPAETDSWSSASW